MSDAPQKTLLEPETSPLVEADPDSINEFISERVNAVMNMKPLLISDADLKVAVNYYRANRARFIIESQAKVPKAVASARKKAAPKSVAEVLDGSDFV